MIRRGSQVNYSSTFKCFDEFHEKNSAALFRCNDSESVFKITAQREIDTLYEVDTYRFSFLKFIFAQAACMRR